MTSASVAVGEPGDDREPARAARPFEVQGGGADLDPLDRRPRRVAPGPARRSRRG